MAFKYEWFFFFFFFFQAEDGIRDLYVTGVQTCALPIFAEQGLLAARRPHFTPRATRVLHVFCTGAVSHLDTFDYKPELVKRHGQPMPGVDKLVTFQGENGNLSQSPWKFKPRGQTGKYVSDLLPL